ncbi:MAG: TRAP-type mannitol/chloroaromatic compound transport system, small permease component [Phormidesmis priestleyi Ana]|uniref:TRAP-type mannitol/chloroaromatic compound transport system, small permease component n=1 Tax=Phormidesmis priestleyi Ana TaxID=1666911 RepID=A0A0P8C5D2_9CYAN|nr:MAG: TRAP-type mannitol/chloroaromatic compound transport system, small permease component [Phormidesmis priestleyi Ana]
MIGVGVWNVLGRYIGNAIGQNLSSNALIETQWYLFDLVFLLGAAYTLQKNEHVRVDVFYAGWHRRRKAIADLFGTLFFLLPFSILVIGFSWDAVIQSWIVRETSPDPGGLARYPIKAMIIVSFVLLILQGISDAIKNWAIIQDALPETAAEKAAETATGTAKETSTTNTPPPTTTEDGQ